MLSGSIRLAGQPRPVAELNDTSGPEIVPSPGEHELQVDRFSSGLPAPIRFQYLLEGANREWSEPTDQRAVTFPSLSPGGYRLLARAVSAEDLRGAPASVGFRMPPPRRPRWWFLSGAACLLALGACALHRYRLGRMLELQRIRTRIATDLHDDIGSSLTQIAILSEVAERRMTGPDPAVAEPISRVSAISRELVDSMSEIVWAINPRNDRVQDLVSRMRRFAADMLTREQISLRFRVPDGVQDVSIDADLRRQVLLIFKEAIHNAVRHSRCSEVRVDLGLEHRRLVLSIGDNGRGFDQRHAPAGHGLPSMEARANSLNGRAEIGSTPGRGTTVRVMIPLARRAAPVRKAS